MQTGFYAQTLTHSDYVKLDTEDDQALRSEHLFGKQIRQIQADLIGVQRMPIFIRCAILTAPVPRLIAICTGAQ